MAEGEELPPVVAALVGNDEDFLAMLERDVARVQEFRAEMQAALGGAGNVGGGNAGAAASQMGEQAAAAAEEASAAFDGMALSVEETLALVDEAGAAMFEQLGATVRTSATVVEQETLGLGEVVDQLTAQVESGALSAAAAFKVLSGAEVDTNAETVTLSKSIATLRGTWAEAAAAAEVAGTSEAALAATSVILTDAQTALSEANTSLVLAYQQLASGAEVSQHTIDQLNTVLAEQADAQKLVAGSTVSLISAETQLNAALLRDESAFMDDAVAMRDMLAAAQMLGVELVDLETELNAANYATLNKAALDARAQLSSQQLAAAQQQLAAANLTLVGTFQRLAEGEAVSAEAQAAALSGVGKAAASVKALGGDAGGLEKVGSAARQAAGEMDVLGSIMYGPVGMGAFMLMSILPMLGGVFHSNAVAASVFTSAVQQDSNAVGDNTAATIQATLAKTNLGDISKQLGLSQAQLIEYAAGEKNVQDQVTKAYEAKQAALDASKSSQQQSGEVTKASNLQTNNAANALYLQKQALDAVTGAVQQAIAQDDAQSQALLAAEQSTQIYNASVNALGDSMLLQTQQTQMSNQATVEYGDRLLAAQSTAQYMAAAVGATGVQMEISAHNTEISNLAMVAYGENVMGSYRDSTAFNAALDASNTAMQIQAQSSSLASVGLLGLGDSQSQVNEQLQYSEQVYTEAQQGAQAYGAALTSLNGPFSTLYGDEASFTGALANLTSSLKSNGTSLDANSAKGYQNAQASQAAANAAIQTSLAVYQNDVANGRASQAYQDANTRLEQQKQEFIATAEKAGANKTAVQQLADELYKLPPKTQLDIQMNDSSVVNALSTTQQLITALKNMPASTIPTIGSRAVPGRATGGDVTAGSLYKINERGQEGYFVPPANGYVVPHSAMAALTSMGSGGGGGAPPVTVHVYLNGREISAEMRADVQQYKTHNSTTGFG